VTDHAHLSRAFALEVGAIVKLAGEAGAIGFAQNLVQRLFNRVDARVATLDDLARLFDFADQIGEIALVSHDMRSQNVALCQKDDEDFAERNWRNVGLPTKICRLRERPRTRGGRVSARLLGFGKKSGSVLHRARSVRVFMDF
jgi:hypothetical protein